MRCLLRYCRLALAAALVASCFMASTASAQYFGSRFGMRPGFSVTPSFSLQSGVSLGVPVPPAYSPGFGFVPRVGFGPSVGAYPGVAVGAIPRWSRGPRVAPVYPTTTYVPSTLARPLQPALPVAPVSPVEMGYRGVFGAEVNIGLDRIDIRTPGFEYHAERGVMPEPSLGGPASYPPTGSLSLSDAADRLFAALSAHPDGEVWLEYLQPGRVARSADSQELADLALRYQGVAANPDLSWITNLDGFRETLQWLSGGVAEAQPTSAPLASTLAPTTAPNGSGIRLEWTEPLDTGVAAVDPTEAADPNDRTEPPASSDPTREGEPTLAPSLPGPESDDSGSSNDAASESAVERSMTEELPAPKPEPLTSI